MKKLLVAAMIAVFSFCCGVYLVPSIVDRVGSVHEYAPDNNVTIHGQMTGYSTVALRNKIEDLKEAGIYKLVIFIMSPGGVVVDAFGACDVIKQAKKEGFHVTTIGLGMIASAAVPVFLSGDCRISGPNTVFMLHKPERAETKDENYIEMMDLDERLYITLVADNCDLTYAEVNNLCNEFTWFTAEQAKRYGMVDEIM